MAAHTEEQFSTFMRQLKVTNRTLSFYSDFNKIQRSVHKIELHLNALNYLLNKDDLEQAVLDLWDENPKIFDVLDILIAVRSTKKEPCLYKEIESWAYHTTAELAQSKEGVLQFLRETGLANLFQSGKITNLVDYVFGVETGLDSNARKNRSGKIMEDTISKIFAQNGIQAKEQVNSKKYPAISRVLGKDKKVFDFAIELPNITYLIEVNFYCGGGSKLNEVARSYTDIAPKINRVPGFEFVWITDGIGWNDAKNKLEEAFAAIPSIYNLSTISEFINKLK